MLELILINIKKYIAYAGLVGIILLLLMQVKSERDERINLKQVVLSQNDSLTFERNKNNELVASIKTIMPTKNNFKTLYKADIDSTKQEFGVKARNIKTLFKTEIIRIDSFNYILKDSIINDTIQLKCWSYQDYPWFYISSCQNDSGKGFVTYESRLRLKSVTASVRNKEKWYKPWKWGKHIETKVLSKNPKDSITEVESIYIK